MPDWKPGCWNGSRAAWSPSWIAATASNGCEHPSCRRQGCCGGHAVDADESTDNDPISIYSEFDPAESSGVRRAGIDIPGDEFSPARRIIFGDDRAHERKKVTIKGLPDGAHMIGTDTSGDQMVVLVDGERYVPQQNSKPPAESPVVRPEGWCGHPSCDLPNCEGKHWTRAFNLADRVVETIRREHAAYVSDIKTRFDPETQRLETTLSVRLHDAEEERRLTDVSTPSAARVVEECLEQYMRDAGGARSISENESSDPNRCYVCTETRPLDDRQVVTLHTNTGDRTCIVCERCRDLVDWEPLDHLVAMPDQARCSVRDGAAASRAVDGEERDDDEGLPRLFVWARWVPETRMVREEVGPADEYDRTALYIDDNGLNIETDGYDPSCATLPSARHILARHDRQRGCYLPDHIRALASELLTEANAVESGWKELLQQFPPCLPSFEQHERVRGKRDAAHRILAILDRLHAEGIC